MILAIGINLSNAWNIKILDFHYLSRNKFKIFILIFMELQIKKQLLYCYMLFVILFMHGKSNVISFQIFSQLREYLSWSHICVFSSHRHSFPLNDDRQQHQKYPWRTWLSIHPPYTAYTLINHICGLCRTIYSTVSKLPPSVFEWKWNSDHC